MIHSIIWKKFIDIVFRCLFPFAMFFNQSTRCRIVSKKHRAGPKNVVHIQMEMIIIFVVAAAAAAAAAAVFVFIFINISLRCGAEYQVDA